MPLLNCGVQFGGADLAYKPASAMPRQHALYYGAPVRRDETATRRAIVLPAPGSRFNVTVNGLRREATTSRLPAVMAIARIGCAWH